MTRTSVALDEPHRLARGIVGQAQDHQIGAVQQIAAQARILAPRGIDGDEFEVPARLEPPVDLEAGGAGLAVDENLGYHRGALETSPR